MTIFTNFLDAVFGTLALNRNSNDLNQLTDRELRDIGISRYDVQMMSKKQHGA